MHCPAPFCPARDSIFTCIVLTVRVLPSTTDLRCKACTTNEQGMRSCGHTVDALA